MSQKEKQKEEKKFNMLDALMLLGGIFAVVVIAYTACWGVALYKQDEEVVISEVEEIYVCNYNEEQDEGHSVIGRVVANNTEEQPLLLEEGYRYTEPVKVIIKRVITNDGESKTYKQLYYSTELEAKTVFINYEKDFNQVTVNGNVITLVCE